MSAADHYPRPGETIPEFLARRARQRAEAHAAALAAMPCPCSHCQDFRFDGQFPTCPIGCRCAVPAPIRSPYRRILRNELKHLRRISHAGYGNFDMTRARIRAAYRLMHDHERAGMPWQSERGYDRQIEWAAGDMLKAEQPPAPVNPAPARAYFYSGPCGCDDDGYCPHSHGMSDSHYA